MQYTIIGNGSAAISAVEAIRENDRNGKITIISDEPYSNYSRPLISYFLAGKVALDEMNFCGKDFYKENRVELILNRKATRLDLKKRNVILSDKRKIPYDRLLIATGGIPIASQIKGRDLEGVFTFTRLSDAKDIERYIKANRVKKAVILGGGLIGLKATEALVELKIEVTIVELADKILSLTFDKKASGIIETALKKIKCKCITNNTIKEIKGKNSKVQEVVLADEKKIPADLVIVAIGTKPNIELTTGTSIETKEGILVDNFMRTNKRDIYAAGDLCQAKGLFPGINRPIAIWPAARKQGRIAGLNMAGLRKEYDGGFAMNSVELCGIATVSAGETVPREGDCRILQYFNKNKRIYKKIVLKQEKIVGIILVGDIERAGIYTGLIKDRIDTSAFGESLLKENFGLINLPKEYRKHLVAGKGVII